MPLRRWLNRLLCVLGWHSWEEFGRDRLGRTLKICPWCYAKQTQERY